MNEKRNKKDWFRRAFWLFLAVIFLVTALGVGILAFWQATHQNNSDEPQTSQVSDCSIQMVQSPEVLPDPAVFKTSDKVTKLSITDLNKGQGPAVKSGDCLTVKYYGSLATTGKKFDANFDIPQALKFRVGQHQVIPGWDQGLIGMQAGGSRRLLIPSDLAYGDQTVGPIPAKSDLVFIVNLLEVK